MEKIQIKDINFSTLQKLKQQGTKSTIYRSDNMCYKILDGLYVDEKKELYCKFLEMDGIQIDNVLLPKQLIVQNDELLGYTMDYFADSMPLSDKFLFRYVNCKETFNYVLKASQILRDIHSHGIFCQDLSFDNILVNDNGKIVFCDLDGCSYGSYVSPFISVIMKNFFVDYRDEKMFLTTNLDRITMMISFCYWVYGKELQNLTKKEYRKLSNKLDTFKNIKQYANELMDKTTSIGEIPYLDELIDPNDKYIIDRNKQLSKKIHFTI